MKRETLQTILGLFIIVIIVAATFLYGNSQRQSQLEHDQALKTQQSASPQASGVVGSSSNSSSGPSSAAVTSPSPNTIQGGQTGAATQGPIDGATPTPVPTPSAKPKPIPDTGSNSSGLIGSMALVAVGLIWLRSRRAVLAAARVRS